MLLFALPLYAIALVYGAAALLPAIYLMRYIYRKDTVEKEPPMLLMSLLIYGVIAALISIILENIGTKVLNSLMDQSTVGYTLVLAFAVVAGRGRSQICHAEEADVERYEFQLPLRRNSLRRVRFARLCRL